MKIGYARVSDPSQNLDRQIAALRAEGCEKIFSDKATGRTVRGRPQLEKAIDALGTDHVFVVAEWDRATRSYTDGIKIITRIAERGALVRVLDREYFDLTTDMGKALLGLLSAIASDERERIVRRAKEGLELARSKGVRPGRKPKLTEHQRRRALERLAAGDSAREIGRDFGVSHSTIVRLK
ncbi:DNA-invertase [Jannaschia pagri]|uniref:DNA-invertase n=1 Tax=Jannaschia pagri TaxID=2829797 RepID=A0ABQ4NRY2_9RHOB|nr:MULTISPECIES: recombinase family protein [unclassified Jannaschia]GIT93364.1 DNA-invertase [Jannaschia sp. AI_61]GIT97151.1 DNA-invertase [Jannaschia sp. AI_62]